MSNVKCDNFGHTRSCTNGEGPCDLEEERVTPAQTRKSNMRERDTGPIDQRWIQNYCDEFQKVAESLPAGLLRDSIFRRLEYLMDLVEAWQKRNIPMDRR